MREFGSEHPAIVLPDHYFENLKRFGRYITYLRCGREALLAVAEDCKKEGQPIILMPAYCCWSMSAPFENAGWKVVYYRLNRDLTVDVEYLKDLLQAMSVQAVLVMNFYGISSTKEAVQEIKSYKEDIVVIEDFSHCTFSFEKIYNRQVDYYVSSIRKSIGVSDGAIVLSNTNLSNVADLNEIVEFSNKRYDAQIGKYRYYYTHNVDDKQLFLGALHDCEDDLNNFNKTHKISTMAMQMLTMINGGEIALARRKNMQHLLTILQGKVDMVPNIERCCDDAPFSLPILVDHRDEFQHKLAQNGVYAPVLWPICEEARQVCEVSCNMADRSLSIPIDQRYGWDDIEDIAQRIIDCIE